MRQVVVGSMTNEVKRLYSEDKVTVDSNTFSTMQLYYLHLTKSEELKIKYPQGKYINVIQLMTYDENANKIIAGLYWNRQNRKYTYIMYNNILWHVRLRKDKPIAFVEAADDIKSNLNRFRALLGKGNSIERVQEYVFDFIATFLHMPKDERDYCKRYIIKLI